MCIDFPQGKGSDGPLEAVGRCIRTEIADRTLEEI